MAHDINYEGKQNQIYMENVIFYNCLLIFQNVVWINSNALWEVVASM